MLMSLFHLGKKREKPHRPKSLPLYQRFRTPFDQTTHKQKTDLKKPLATQTNVQNNEHLLKNKILTTDRVASNFNHAFPSSTIVFIYVPDRQVARRPCGSSADIKRSTKSGRQALED